MIHLFLYNNTYTFGIINSIFTIVSISVFNNRIKFVSNPPVQESKDDTVKIAFIMILQYMILYIFLLQRFMKLPYLQKIKEYYHAGVDLHSSSILKNSGCFKKNCYQGPHFSFFIICQIILLHSFPGCSGSCPNHRHL